MTEAHTADVYPPREIARRVEQAGVAKAGADLPALFVLALLAGAFISLGALFSLLVVTDSTLGLGPTRLLGGLAFSLGLILVVIAGAELFTGNNLIAMAWASGLIGSGQVLRHWTIVYVGNVIGCLGTVLLVGLADMQSFSGGALAQTAIHVVEAKVALSPLAAFSRGVLCNALVCLAVWLAMGGRSAADKILAIIFPITAFVAIGLEHSIANWFLLPLAMLWQAPLSLAQVLGNLFWVTLGNVLGGTLLVAGVYWLAYLRPERRAKA